MEAIIQEVKARGRKILTEIEAKEVLKSAGIPVVETFLARTEGEALAISQQVGFPVVLKIYSADIVHKTEAGGIALNLNTEEEVSQAYQQLVASARARYPQAEIGGVSVQKMIKRGTEVIMGMTRDPQFGAMIMFGLGGIFIEVLRDVAFRFLPLSREDASEMISEIKGHILLEGFRGSEPVNREALIDTLLKLSSFIEANPEIEEVDINPLFASSQGVTAVDARIVLS